MKPQIKYPDEENGWKRPLGEGDIPGIPLKKPGDPRGKEIESLKDPILDPKKDPDGGATGMVKPKGGD